MKVLDFFSNSIYFGSNIITVNESFGKKVLKLPIASISIPTQTQCHKLSQEIKKFSENKSKFPISSILVPT